MPDVHGPQASHSAAADRRELSTEGLRRGPWLPTEEFILRKTYPNMVNREIAELLGRPLSSIDNKAALLGLRKSASFMAQKHGCFRKGQTPPNKGVRRPGWAVGRMAETQFKKGRPPSQSPNYVPIGSHRISRDGFLERKVTDDPRIAPARRWVGVHRLVWEAAHGQVPPGHAVAFRDGRRTTVLEEITLDRLELVTRAELMRRNSFHNRYPKEIGLAIQARAALVRQINRKSKQ